MSSLRDPKDPWRILIVDDHSIVRLGVRLVIGAEADMVVCGEAATPADALELAHTRRPDLAIVDLSLGGASGLDLIRQLHDGVPSVPSLVLSMHDEALFAERAVRAGARGYIMKDEAATGLAAIARRVLTGHTYLSPRMSQHFLQALGRDVPPAGGRLGGLTDRELEVFEMVGRGVSTAEIARRLTLSSKTVETYRANIKAKLNLKDATDLVRHATSWIERL